MSFNIFGPATKDSIRVGYISTDRGFVDGVTICEANDYARLNPGTQFIFKTRNFVKYLNINEVNKLTPDDIISAGSSCAGIQLDADCGKPQAYFYGGAGVGVQGNPVIGEDGALLAIDLVHGGFGYQYPPLVEVKDNCGIGAGAVTRAVLGEIVETVEFYDQEEDFEEYEICDPTEAGYGLRYGPDGKVLGDWDPKLYANLTKDPIAIEIKEYQDFLKQEQSPWWTTQKENPLRVTSGNRTTRIKHNVKEPNPGGTWTEFLNTYAISPVPPSNAKGSDFGADLFTFEWEKEFPYDGEYVFRGSADGEVRDFYLDNEKITTLANYKDNPVSVTKTIKAGVHRIRLDLKNGQIKERVINQQVEKQVAGVDFIFKNNGYYMTVGGNNEVEVSLSLSYDDDPNAFGTAITKIVVPNPNGRPITLERRTVGGSFEQRGSVSGKSIFRVSEDGYGPILLFGNVKEPRLSRQNLTYGRNSSKYGQIDFFDNDGSDVNAFLKSDGARNLQESRIATSQSSNQTTGSQTRKIFNTIDYINKANRQLWRLDPRAGRDSGFINQYGILPFDPNSNEAQTESFSGVHTIVWDNINFPIDGNYNIEIMVDDDVTLTFTGASTETVITKKGFSSPGKSTGKSLETRAFKKGNYRLVAELKQINVGPLGKGNPMALAVNVETSFVENEVVASKSWNENPMGIALTIDAPLPPIPQEPIPQQEGRCPNNPIWSTRFPNGKQKWWPVYYRGAPGFQWSNFMNRYAISPIPPLSRKGTDGGGIVYQNEWEVDIPYDGFYALRSTVDNAGKISIDNQPVMQANYIPTNLRNTRGGSGVERRSGIGSIDGGIIYNFRENNPKPKKVFLTKGRHTIQVEVENGITEIFEKVNKKVFSTKDWLFKPKVVETQVQTPTSTTVDEWVRVADEFAGPVRQLRDRGGIGPVTGGTFHRYDLGTWFRNRRIRQGGDWNDTNPNTNYIENPFNSNQRLTLGTNRGGIFAIAVWERRTAQSTTTTTTTIKQVSGEITKQSPTAAGVVYEGPTPIANYVSDFISPVFQDVNANPNEEIQGRTWIFRWSNVDFPVNGQYTLTAEADDNLTVKVDGVEVGKAKVFEGRRKIVFNATSGKKTIQLELSNIRIPNTGFQQNPVVAFAQITVPVDSATGISKPWTENPMGISAILIPPPCPKKIKGKGVVTDVIVDDPGNGFPRPGTGGYPVALRLKDVVVEDPGINYSCGIDKIQITPNNGAVLDYECDTFGRIVNVKILNPGLGFTNYPEITLPSETGINATFRPQFEVVRDPIVTEPQKLIQVTDLVGLKQTGYVDGRPYYGAVFYKEGVRYAGFYETPGDLVQVYDTLKESIDSRVTTPPSAIQRQGTDVTSNDPRLNLPNTPENLI